jgi:hypothetical protein
MNNSQEKIEKNLENKLMFVIEALKNADSGPK